MDKKSIFYGALFMLISNTVVFLSVIVMTFTIPLLGLIMLICAVVFSFIYYNKFSKKQTVPMLFDAGAGAVNVIMYSVGFALINTFADSLFKSIPEAAAPGEGYAQIIVGCTATVVIGWMLITMAFLAVIAFTENLMYFIFHVLKYSKDKKNEEPVYYENN